jgi:hypothetical protein
MYPLSSLGNSSTNIPLSLLGNGSVEILPRQRIYTEQQKNCWTRHFLRGPCRTNESGGLVLPRTTTVVAGAINNTA